MSLPLASAPAPRLADGVLVINLDHRPERMERFTNMARHISVLQGWERLPAVNGVEIPGYGQPPWFRHRPRDRCWAGRAGCTLSHRNAIACAKDRGWHSVLILEDDIQLGASFDTMAQLVIEHTSTCPKHWDACYLGLSQPVGPSLKLHALGGTQAVYQIFGCTGTFAYILKREAFDWLLAKLPTPETIWTWVSRHRAIDRWYARNLSARFTVQAVSPNLIGHYSSFSDIGQRAGADLLTAESATHQPEHLQPSGKLAFQLHSACLRLRFLVTMAINRIQGAMKRARGF
ncbi:MAG: glycosyltransferase family 25 protein [Verrucomicrobia bacterium]|nr:glycosyltransferase family 25 protein [Verrucomicrobiota bacterium]